MCIVAKGSPALQVGQVDKAWDSRDAGQLGGLVAGPAREPVRTLEARCAYRMAAVVASEKQFGFQLPRI